MKFRHYDTRLNEMRYSDKHNDEFFVEKLGIKYMYAIPRSESGLGIVYYKSYKVDRFTGLKDSKGVLIYEGDMVGGIFTGVVEWSKEDCGFWIKNLKTKGGGMLNKDYMKNFAVIGNIYETLYNFNIEITD